MTISPSEPTVLSVKSSESKLAPVRVIPVIPDITPPVNVAVPSVKEPPVIAPEAFTVVAPEIAPALVMPPLVLFKDFDTTSPSASTLKPIIVTVPMVKSPDPSMLVAPDKAPPVNVAEPSVKEPPVIAPEAFTVVAPEI